MKVAIVYQSPYGQTKKIAQQIKKNMVFESQFKDNVHLFEVTDAHTPVEIYGPIDIYIIGFPVYMGKFPKGLLKWVFKNHSLLQEKRLGFFMVSLNAADTRYQARKADDLLLRKLIQKTELVPDFITSFAGALHYTKYGFIKKLILKKISHAAGGPTDTKQNHELTDWKAVEEFSRVVQENDKGSPLYYKHQLSSLKTYNLESLTLPN